MLKTLAILAGVLALSGLVGADAAAAQDPLPTKSPPATQSAASTRPLPERVTFPSADHKTTLVGYLFRPGSARGANAARVPAIVMMHGRSGAYSTAAKGVY